MMKKPLLLVLPLLTGYPEPTLAKQKSANLGVNVLRQYVRNSVDQQSRSQVTLEGSVHRDASLYGNFTVSKNIDSWEVQAQVQNVSSQLSGSTFLVAVNKSFDLIDGVTATSGTMNGFNLGYPSNVLSMHYALLGCEFLDVTLSAGGYYANKNMAVAKNNVALLLNLDYELVDDFNISIKYARVVNNIGEVSTQFSYFVGGFKPYLGIGFSTAGEGTPETAWLPYSVFGATYEY